MKGELKVNPAIWNKLTDEAKSLMTSLLNKSPKDRITAREALKHAFITKNAPHVRKTNLIRNQSKDVLSVTTSINSGAISTPQLAVDSPMRASSLAESTSSSLNENDVHLS